MRSRVLRSRKVLATALVVLLIAGVVVLMRATDHTARTVVVGYFDNSNGLFAGDDVRIRGVPVGKVDKIEPQPLRSKITFWFDRKYKVPAQAKAAILSPQLVTGRAIQLTPPGLVGSSNLVTRLSWARKSSHSTGTTVRSCGITAPSPIAAPPV